MIRMKGLLLLTEEEYLADVLLETGNSVVAYYEPQFECSESFA